MSIYGEIPKGKSRSTLSQQDLLKYGVDIDAMSRRMGQVNHAQLKFDLSVAERNKAKTGKEYKRALKHIIKSEIYLAYINKLIQIEPVAGCLFRPEEFKARYQAWHYARTQSRTIRESIMKSITGAS